MQKFYLAFILTVLTANLSGQGIQDGLVFYAPFDGSYVNLVEWVKPSNHGVKLVEDKFGNPHRAIAFDGIDDYLNYGDIVNLGYGSFSISVWVMLGDKSVTSGQTTFLQKGYWDDSIGEYQGMGLQALSLQDMPSAYRLVYPDAPIHPYDYYCDLLRGPENNPERTWMHLVVTRSGKTVQYYVNGQLASTSTSKRVENVSSEAPLALGAHVSPEGELGGTFFSGALDEIRIYNRRLNSRDIAHLYDQFLLGPEAAQAKAEQSPQLEFTTYPNPTSRILNVKLPSAKARRAYIIDANGRKIRIHQLQEAEEAIPVAGLPPGNYFLSVEEDGMRVTKKFIKVGAVLP